MESYLFYIFHCVCILISFFFSLSPPLSIVYERQSYFTVYLFIYFVSDQTQQNSSVASDQGLHCFTGFSRYTYKFLKLLCPT